MAAVTEARGYTSALPARPWGLVLLSGVLWIWEVPQEGPVTKAGQGGQIISGSTRAEVTVSSQEEAPVT